MPTISQDQAVADGAPLRSAIGSLAFKVGATKEDRRVMRERLRWVGECMLCPDDAPWVPDGYAFVARAVPKGEVRAVEAGNAAFFKNGIG